ncbi:integrator complex subunit 4 [Platysternon megacephalum]|uniref:Integrator complex subunit 4 n=1 Tax=Platysternon megacephalum TaxID=55544 RepID=A0A4D9F4J4_9SAUR|nr:integrator complex subunit 4 [Platysternon megacephalum]
MAQNVQNVTLSLTLPITCHICLGKVRHPVICVNNHVFCSICIDVWLKNNSQCPACRIPITPDNPCKEIIGGTSESEPIFSPTVRKHLRKTRLELLHKEYEDEIESLQKEVEELRGKNLGLEAQLKTVLDPGALDLCNTHEESHRPTDEASRAGPETVEEWTKKLKAANDLYEKVKDDVEKLKEANKKLRLENGGLVRENLRLKAEVDSRSPQKFGRFTAAALQSKVEQCERETNRLKKALERSDKYIEELEGQLTQLKGSSGETQNVSTVSERALFTDNKGSESSEEDIASLKSQVERLEKKTLTTSQSPDNLEQLSGNGLSDSDGACSNSASQDSSNGPVTHSCPTNKELFSGCQEVLLDIAATNMDACLEPQWDKGEDCAPYKDEELYELPAPCTPSLSLSCLQLNTPDIKDSPLVKQESTGKPSAFLRKLEFDDLCDTSDDCNKDSPEHSASPCNGQKKVTCFTSAKPVFWNSCSTNYAENLNFEGSEQNAITSHSGEPLAKSSDKHELLLSKRLHTIRSSEMNRTRTSSEASMDAAYLDKISELDSMMSESDNSKSPYYNFKSSELENPSKSTQCSELLNESDKKPEEKNKQNSVKCPESSEQLVDWKPATFSILSPSGLDMNEHFPLFSGQNSETSEIKPQNCLFQREFSQSFLFSNSQRLFEEQKLGSSIFKVSSEIHNLHNQLQSPWASSFIPEKKHKSVNQSTKRKIQSSLSSASPSKTTKN